MPKIIFDHIKNIKFYTNLALCSSWNYSSCKLVKHVVYLGKTPNSQYKIFTAIPNAKFSSAIEYFIHYVNVEMWIALFNVNYLTFSGETSVMT